MKVIVFAASKGGASKTTLMHNVSVYAAAAGHGVLLADLDPQASLSKLWDARGEMINPRLVTNITNVSQSVAILVSAGYDKEFMLVDTPGSLVPIMRQAIEAADIVVLPTRPNPVDLKAQSDVIALVQQAGKMDQTLFVLAQTEKGDLLDRARGFVSSYGRPVLTMPKRAEYARAQDKGGAGCETNKECRADIKKIWEAITATSHPIKATRKEHSSVAKYQH